MNIRRFQPSDIESCVEILRLNDQYKYPEVDGPEAMMRIYQRPENPFFISEENGSVVGMIRGCYDGSRPLIWQLSIHPNYQGRGIGKALVKEVAKFFKEKGHKTVSITANHDSKSFYEGVGFEEIPIVFMLADIDKIL
jgi:ribosomal protein S18 acetylase RimI-like enzyme